MALRALRVAVVVGVSSLLMTASSPSSAAGLHFLTPAQVDPSLLLPPPPDSDTQKAELAELDHIQAAMSKADFDRATVDNDNETPTLYATVLGPSFDLTKLPATAHLLDDVITEEKAAAKLAKVYFHRSRPYVFDTALKTCEKPDANPQNSYPSGHATLGFATGVVLAALMPAKSQVILARSADYAHERLVCGVHYRSDIAAGQVLGTAVALQLLANKDFRAEFDAAAAELRPLQ
jgi:acid phosphatase (class A)